MPSRCERLCFFQAQTFNVNQIRSALLALPLVAASSLALAQATAEPIRLALIERLSGERLLGTFADAGAAMFRKLLLASGRVKRCGGVRVAGVALSVAIERADAVSHSHTSRMQRPD